MHITKVILRNFRNFKNATFKLGKGVNTLIGENGSGKTNFFHAIRLLLDDSLPSRAIFLEETDFNRCLPNWRGQWIIVTVDFDELDMSEGTQILTIHGTGDADNDGKGRYSFYFRPKKVVRKKLFELSQDSEKSLDKLNMILSEITLETYEAVLHCRGKADFSDDEIYRKYVGDFENIIFPDPDDKSEDYLGILTPPILSVPREVTCTFIKALRDVVSDLRNTRTNPLIQLLKGTSKDIELQQASEISKRVKDLNKEICSLNEVKAISNGIKESLRNTIGTTYAPNINVRSELPDDIEKLMQSLTLWVGDPDDGMYQGQIKELSLGGANLIYLSLKLLEYELKQSTDKAAHFLLIEEPEAHIHTHIQKTLFEKYSYQKTQVIISTHSTHISAASHISRVNILCKGKCETDVCHPSSGLVAEECNRIERYLDAVRSTLLFAKGIILVEGDAELILIPAMFKAVFGISLDEIGISLVNMSSTVFTNVARIFDDKRVRRKCAIITDLDTSIIPFNDNEKIAAATVTPPSVEKVESEEEKKYIRSCLNSQAKGLERKIALDAFCQNNRWIEAFYAKHTFEVDFLMAGNSYEIKKTLKSIYKRKADIDKSSKALDSDDVSVAGREVLRLAEKEGKGWLALMVAEQLVYNTYIPEYILKAIAFASSHISDVHFEVMARHRILAGVNAKDESFINISSKIKMPNDEDYNTIEFLKTYCDELTDDELTLFMSYMR